VKDEDSASQLERIANARRAAQDHTACGGSFCRSIRSRRSARERLAVRERQQRRSRRAERNLSHTAPLAVTARSPPLAQRSRAPRAHLEVDGRSVISRLTRTCLHAPRRHQLLDFRRAVGDVRQGTAWIGPATSTRPCAAGGPGGSWINAAARLRAISATHNRSPDVSSAAAASARR
jgi:hypothetical protein